MKPRTFEVGRALDVVADKDQAFCFLKTGHKAAGIGVPIAGGLLVNCDIADLPDEAASMSHPEPDLMDGRNVIVATHNGEPIEPIVDWLTYHYRKFDVTGVVIIVRDQAEQMNPFWKEVSNRLADSELAMTIIVLSSPTPLGKPGLPPEQHPYCVSEAPGRERMKLPEPDPWTAPLGEIAVYEIVRMRFLGKARAVSNIDLHDLLRSDPDSESPFDLAVKAKGGFVELVGQHCYPWQVRKDARPHFADHVCVQFDTPRFRRRWCAAPSELPETAVFKLIRVANTPVMNRASFDRFMAVRHCDVTSGPIVPKSSLVEDQRLISLSQDTFDHTPRRPPDMTDVFSETTGTGTTLITCMKNEGPFLLEWLAYHRAIGAENFLIYTNDCTDGTDSFLNLLQDKGYVQHRENPFKGSSMKPQHAALMAASDEPVVRNADWLISMDVDEFINIKVGEGRLNDLYQAVGDANMISLTWRLFGNADIREFRDEFTLAQFDRCADEYAPKPHQAWGFKTLFRNNGIYKKMGVHRPKGLNPQLVDKIRWVNGSGEPMPVQDYRNAWRSRSKTVGYDLVTLNHYAVRNAESFLVKRDRGRVNHTDRDQGLAYWFRMNANTVQDTSIKSRIPMMEREFARLMSDPQIAAQQHSCVAAHQSKIRSLRNDPAQSALYAELTSPRMEKLSTMHRYFGANVFHLGPQTIPNSVLWAEHDDDFFFTVAIRGTLPTQ